ncbi:MAG TPA: glycosyltransferase family 4 protein [Vicinamibacterales bacterium]|nr:glycosyltransferase family 4 protein [Vicinamibacterales bacterium]
MKIAQVAPLYESVPPALYGGTERVVAYLTDELVVLGHDVTLYASGDSRTRATLKPMCTRSLRLTAGAVDHLAHHVRMLERVFRDVDDFDIVHFHVDYLHFPLSRRHRLTHVTTLHGRLDLADLQPLYDDFHDMPVISISDAQRRPLPQARWVGTVAHGLPPDLHRFDPIGGETLVFLGRISPEKGIERAVEIARRSGHRLRVAAKVDRTDREYFASVAPILAQPFVEFIGEVDDAGKSALLAQARALLFPIDWQEPFGLVMIEALACGTPVIAWRGGSVEEVIDNGRTGFIVDSLDEAVDAVERIDEIDRRVCRQEFESRFTARRMARDYVAIYDELLSGRPSQPTLVVSDADAVAG